jgi:hypothetical protein
MVALALAVLAFGTRAFGRRVPYARQRILSKNRRVPS